MVVPMGHGLTMVFMKARMITGMWDGATTAAVSIADLEDLNMGVTTASTEDFITASMEDGTAVFTVEAIGVLMEAAMAVFMVVAAAAKHRHLGFSTIISTTGRNLRVVRRQIDLSLRAK
jgi:hypothetical protein